jgi:hypothetical protein
VRASSAHAVLRTSSRGVTAGFLSFAPSHTLLRRMSVASLGLGECIQRNLPGISGAGVPAMDWNGMEPLLFSFSLVTFFSDYLHNSRMIATSANDGRPQSGLRTVALARYGCRYRLFRCRLSTASSDNWQGRFANMRSRRYQRLVCVLAYASGGVTGAGVLLCCGFIEGWRMACRRQFTAVSKCMLLKRGRSYSSSFRMARLQILWPAWHPPRASPVRR